MQRSKGTRTIKPRGCLSKNGPLPSRKLGTALALLAAALLLVAASANAAQSVSDRDVTLAIEVELALDEAVDANRIDISTQKGIVMLSGSVGNMLAKERAASIAQCIVGVRGVVNRIEVKTIIRKDPELAKAVERALFLDPATDSYEVGATAKNGAVTLSGTVQSWQEKQLCADVAKGVRGVTEVNNEIMIREIVKINEEL